MAERGVLSVLAGMHMDRCLDRPPVLSRCDTDTIYPVHYALVVCGSPELVQLSKLIRFEHFLGDLVPVHSLPRQLLDGELEPTTGHPLRTIVAQHGYSGCEPHVV